MELTSSSCVCWQLHLLLRMSKFVQYNAFGIDESKPEEMVHSFAHTSPMVMFVTTTILPETESNKPEEVQRMEKAYRGFPGDFPLTARANIDVTWYTRCC